MKKLDFVLLVFIFFCSFCLYSQRIPGSYYDFIEQTQNMKANHNSSSLIIYRPENTNQLNEIRCFFKLEDMNGNDVTYEKSICSATYEWVTWRSDLSKITKKNPKELSYVFERNNQGEVLKYQKRYFLSGGIAMHLNLKKGKYRISVYTPIENQNGFKYSTDTKSFEWKSNSFFYDTENPTKVIFVSPTFTENGFYAGGWKIDYKAPKHRLY